MKIFTAVNGDPNDFDKDVNGLLSMGWVLERRELGVTNDGRVFHYAQLVLSDEEPEPEPQAITWQAAVKVLHDTCEEAGRCNYESCPMYNWCENFLSNEPGNWHLPKGV